MPSLNALNIPQLLKKHGLRPNKLLGQNFLVDEVHLGEILRKSKVGEKDEVLEVGAGLGSLSRHLAETAKRVVAVELDQALLPPLREVLSDYSNVEIVNDDILAMELPDVFSEPGYMVIANIPYYLTSKLIRHLLEQTLKPARLSLTVQKEVAERACAQPPRMSLLALSVQLYGDPLIVHHIPAGAFFPVPKVDSAALNVTIFEKPRIHPEQVQEFFALAKTAFRQKRKTLANSLATYPGWSKEKAEVLLRSAGIDPKRRPQTLSLGDWARLLDSMEG